jgi:tetratricopeptide (TPR) repeat protein
MGNQGQPNTAEGFVERGNSCVDKGDYDQAIANYNEALKLDPNFAAAYYQRSNAYRLKGDHNRTIADWTQVIRLDPNCADAKEELRWLRGKVEDKK